MRELEKTPHQQLKADVFKLVDTIARIFLAVDKDGRFVITEDTGDGQISSEIDLSKFGTDLVIRFVSSADANKRDYLLILRRYTEDCVELVVKPNSVAYPSGTQYRNSALKELKLILTLAEDRIKADFFGDTVSSDLNAPTLQSPGIDLRSVAEAEKLIRSDLEEDQIQGFNMLENLSKQDPRVLSDPYILEAICSYIADGGDAQLQETNEPVFMLLIQAGDEGLIKLAECIKIDEDGERNELFNLLHCIDCIADKFRARELTLHDSPQITARGIIALNKELKAILPILHRSFHDTVDIEINAAKKFLNTFEISDAREELAIDMKIPFVSEGTAQNVLALLAMNTSKTFSCTFLLKQSDPDDFVDEKPQEFIMKVMSLEEEDGVLKRLVLGFCFSNEKIYFPSMTVEHPVLGELVARTKSYGKGKFKVSFDAKGTENQESHLNLLLMLDSKVSLRLCN